jgi:ATP-binding cassette, subfamily C, bacteriocin exporter
MTRNRQIKIRQRDVTDCGPACIASVAAWHQSFIPVARIRQIAGTDQKGTSALGLVRAFEAIGMTAKGVRCKADYLHQIPFPAIAHMVLSNKLHHYLVIYGVSEKKVKIMDPATGRIENRKRKEFEQQWSGILIISAPGGTFQPAGKEITNRKRFLYLMKPHRRIFVQAIIGAMLYTLLGFSTSVYIQKLTDYIIVFQLKQALHIAGIIMLLLIVFQLVLSAVKNTMILRTGQLIDARLILGYYKHLLRLPQQFFDSMRVGEIISRINDAAKIRQFLSDTFINIVLNVMILIFSCIILFLFHWKLALLVTMILPAYGVIYAITNRINRKQERIIMEKSAELESQLVESINNIRTVKQLNLEQVMSEKMEWRFIDLLKAGYKSGTNAIFSGTSSDFVSKIFTLFLLWTGAVLIFRNELTIGQMLSFYTILGYMSGPASGLIGINRIYQNAIIAADRLFEVMELESPDNSGKIETESLAEKEITFRNVCFSYGSRGDLFKNLHLTIEPGKITVIVGESGSGKSSLAQLITGLYEINKGSISIGNHMLSQYSHESLSKCIAVVPQQTELFSGSILENIAPGEIHPDLETIMEICSKVGLNGLLTNLPRGINTQVGENGFSLSGGERQKISLARALYRSPSIIILDEATSSLDTESEERVMRLITEERDQGKTIVVITHRLSALSYADKVLIMDKGKVMESGAPESLCKENEIDQQFLKKHDAFN